ncbi:DNA methylase family protein [Burkholderia pseudomallei MSHR983]|uniref:TRM11 family SAM-dependent methyltransferase n=1 Tax=Burkholderia pseudomallei TaxID=28450 RepID=UPI00053718EA|nr:DNA methyltransferase [Burkholderia pseudomallei]KGU63703.1 DNA methylase family protein [Burkholderia pseudomallei MSHR983]
MNTLLLNWHQYKYYPYEQQLAVREVNKLLAPRSLQSTETGIVVEAPNTPAQANRLVYVASQSRGANGSPKPTQQALLERVNGNGPNRQSTRYSVHGLHEYKGKFNPQVAKALLNIFGVTAGHNVLDPFCGSGTSLVEAAHLGINAFGTDINPLAVYLANAKLKALATPAELLLSAAQEAVDVARKSKRIGNEENERQAYLQSWFPQDVLRTIEHLRQAISLGSEDTREILFAIASNLLRDYSLQEPSDLRIRRRTSPMPEIFYLSAFETAVANFAKKLADSQGILGLLHTNAHAHLHDCRLPLSEIGGIPSGGFDAVLTSPPYATALPYIDTQRLSLVWLNLLAPADILSLESQLVGSREIRGQSKQELLEILLRNESGLPDQEANLCVELQETLSEQDGFRRQAVPRLLYRYFAGMADSFASVREVVRPGGMYGLIVGGNHTVLSGKRFDIDTPSHLASLAVSRGWNHVETVELQTYKRYGLHAKNASTTEALVILEA